MIKKKGKTTKIFSHYFLSPDQASFPAWTFFFCISEEDAEMLKVIHQQKEILYKYYKKKKKEIKMYSTQCGNSTE